MTQSAGAPAPEPSNYEFTEPQNKSITELSGAMTFVGTFTLVVGVLSLLVGAVAVVMGLISHAGHIATGFQALANGAIYLLMGLWIRKSSAAFTNIVKTQGSDISNLMLALDELKKMFSLSRILLILYLAIMVLAFFAGMMLAATGRGPSTATPPAMTAPSK